MYQILITKPKPNSWIYFWSCCREISHSYTHINL